jgi:hypothetical protein
MRPILKSAIGVTTILKTKIKCPSYFSVNSTQRFVLVVGSIRKSPSGLVENGRMPPVLAEAAGTQ